MNAFRGIEQRFQALASTPPIIEGVWSQVRVLLDPVTAEQLAIGVLVEINGCLHAQFVENFDRITCAYGTEGKVFVESIIDIFEKLMLSSACTTPLLESQSFSPQLIIDKRGIIRGSSADDIVNKIFSLAVPLGKLPSNHKGTVIRFPTIRTVTLWSEIQQQLKNQMGDLYSQILTSEYAETRSISNYASLYNRSSKKIGSLVSTVYGTHEKFENNCWTAMSNLELATEQLPENKAFLFILKPTDTQLLQLPTFERQRRRDFMDKFHWQLSKRDIEPIAHFSSAELAQNIVRWSDVPQLAGV